ncbi:hypothetical protein ElyMa_002645300 [Elysia marginata]|uniref:Uncharacterized protein n=1 Tax=Elysia marginata TaxID=1093978 RepID=A0AAV4H7F0_9GAST|nr:hypothetical protein ElyMa_002645300 [Elysia marginata]
MGYSMPSVGGAFHNQQINLVDWSAGLEWTRTPTDIHTPQQLLVLAWLSLWQAPSPRVGLPITSVALHKPEPWRIIEMEDFEREQEKSLGPGEAEVVD